MTKKSGLRIDTVLKRVITFRSRIDGFMACVIADQRTHEWACARMSVQVWQSPQYAVLPEWARRDITGYWHGKMDMLGRYLVLFAYKFEDKLYRTESNFALGLPTAIRVDWPHWRELQLKHHAEKGRFVPEDCEEYGSYWPSGKPYSITVPQHASERVAA